LLVVGFHGLGIGKAAGGMENGRSGCWLVGAARLRLLVFTMREYINPVFILNKTPEGFVFLI